jgi:peptidoglycan/xylan/chitin deacetylase (PgdA/CDA1 family)
MNVHIKSALEIALTRSGVAWLRQAILPRSSVLVLAYHDIVPTGTPRAGDASLHLPQHEFARQLDLIARTHEVVPLSSIFDGRAAAAPRVAITFDDAYAGALTAGVEELEQRGLPATVFVTPGLLERITWWDLVATEGDGGVPDHEREHALWKLGGMQEKVLAWAPPAASGDRGRLPRIGSLEQLRAAAGYRHLDLASHTWSHANLSASTPKELALELSLARDWISQRFPRALSLLSYPYGLSTHAVEVAAEENGYSAAFRVTGGWIPDIDSADRFALPRYNVPAGLSLSGLRLRLAGIGTG